MLLPKRIWQDIPGYEGLYQVSNTGKVRSLNYRGTGKKQILKQETTKNGYKKVQLRKNGKGKNYLVHRLVAQAFIPNPNNWPQVNHKDENKANNAVWNLEWCDSTYNNNYGTRNKKVSEARKGIQFTEKTKKKLSESMKGKNNPGAKPILMFTKEGAFIRRFDCIADANKYFGTNRRNTNIGDCARHKSKTAYGYIFKFEKDCK